MWLKRKRAPSAEIPKLRDEYKKLLNETLPDVGPLTGAAQAVARPCSMARVAAPVDEAQQQAHQRALRPFLDKGRQSGQRPAKQDRTGAARLQTAGGVC